MSVSPLGPAEVLVLLAGAISVYFTSRWSPLEARHRFRIALFASISIFLFIPLGFASVKRLESAFLFGESKAASFYSWAFGLWFALVLLRNGVRLYRLTGVGFALVFLGLLGLVIWSECRLVFG